MGIVVVAIIGGLATTVLSSHVHREQAQLNSVLTSAMERVKSADVDRTCAAIAIVNHPYLIEARKVSFPAGWSQSQLTIASIEYETFTAGGAGLGWDPDVTKCDVSPTSPLTPQLQLITLKLASPDGRVSQTSIGVPCSPPNPCGLSFIKGGK